MAAASHARGRGRLFRRFLSWSFAYWQPLRQLAARAGPLRAAPVAVGFLAACLLVTLAWDTPGAGHRLVAACCAYQGWQPSLGDTTRMVASAFLLQNWYEVVWTVAATVLVTAPFEVWMGSGRMLTAITLGHLVPTAVVAAVGLAQGHRLGGGGLDVGSSAVIAAAAAGLAVRSRSLAVAGCLIIALLVAGFLQSPLTTVEHLAAIIVGMLATVALSGRGGRSGLPSQAASGLGSGASRRPR